MSTSNRPGDIASSFRTQLRSSAFARRGLLLALAVLILGQWYLHIDGWASIPATDVRVYAQGGRWALERWDLYSETFPSAFNGYLPFSYPPFGAITMVPLGILPDAWIFPVWTLVSVACLLAILVVSFGPLLQRMPSTGSRLAAVCVGLLLIIPTGPVSELLPFGQIGTVLTLACLLDMVGRTWRLPQGVLVGVMTAVKLTPGLFIVHWAVNRQWRPALTSLTTLVLCWVVGALWLPTSTATYLWGQRLIVNPTARAARPDMVFNQSIGGLLARMNDGQIPALPFAVLAIVLCAVGLAAAAIAVKAQAPLSAAAIVGLTSVIVSPVSWSHHAVWLIPALGAIIGGATGRRRVVLGALLLAALYYPTRGWMPLEVSLHFREVWFALYCLTIVALVAIAWRSLKGNTQAF
ncbi:MAG: glycosyltransferase 87 family protein [Candidatus Nanopelagicales bacterium]|nr:glycosyltransferase 87 family protein [Actinomycetota bacterium]HNL50532.1 glycosyltransferase 87 family protein [Actinomycetota bacterium]HNO14718.1 glycosyltransferase 87 family protein [Actinomycetota bacterium]HUM86147.1 glycosyltransferase 87 family protein [Actinomycetota bacterium]